MMDESTSGNVVSLFYLLRCCRRLGRDIDADHADHALHPMVLAEVLVSSARGELMSEYFPRRNVTGFKRTVERRDAVPIASLVYPIHGRAVRYRRRGWIEPVV